MNDNSSVPPSSDSDAFLREVAAAPEVVSAPEPDLSGQTLGKYQVGARLGEGGMGVVYEATDTVLQRKVAFKVLSRKMLGDERARARLLREARSLAAVNHAGIAAIYEVAEANGHVFIAMERVVGETLRAHLAQGPLALEVARRIVIDIARALEHAHRAGIIHRDLKPENVMLGEGGAVKILDFGLAKVWADESSSGDNFTSTLEGHVVGTPSYMSPEQAKGQKLDGRSDLFALGSIFYELITGKRAFSGASLVEVLAAIDRDAPPPPRQARPEVSVELERTVLRCLEKSPEARFESAGQLVSALESRVSIAAPSRARRRWAMPVMGLVFAAVAAGGGWTWLRPLPDPLASPGAVVACPPLSVRGVPEPNGWLGAAAASMVCQRVGVARWVQTHHSTLPPAALLGLPRSPSESISDDPFSASDARERALRAATQEAAAFVDGRVEHSKAGFTVALELKAADGRELARGEGNARNVQSAVRLAMEPLWGEGRISLPAKFPAVQTELRGVESPAAALALQDFIFTVQSGTGMDEAVARLEPHQKSLGDEWRLARYLQANARGEKQAFEAPLDRTSPERLVRTVMLNMEAGAPLDAAALADELHAMTKPEQPPVTRHALGEAEARLRMAAHQNERATNLVLATISEFGRSDAWFPLVVSQVGRPGFFSATRAFAAWKPHIPDAWLMLASLPPRSGEGGMTSRTYMADRATLLAPDSAEVAASVADAYLEHSQLDGARLLAARLLASTGPSKMVGELVMLQVETAEVRFRAGLDRAKIIITDRQPELRQGTEEQVIRAGAELARILGEGAEFAELIYTHLVQPDPPLLDRGPFGSSAAATACAYGKEQVAWACTGRLRALSAAGYFRDLTPMHLSLIEGSAAYARGAYTEAVAAFRKGALDDSIIRTVVADAFDRSGDAATASRLEEPHLQLRGTYGGAGTGHVREARRAWARGDYEKARALAQRVVNAWSGADAEIPAVAEMQALLAKKPGEK